VGRRKPNTPELLAMGEVVQWFGCFFARPGALQPIVAVLQIAFHFGKAATWTAMVEILLSRWSINTYCVSLQ
jgi:hypothetical protein